jgi:transposase/transposase-like protein
MRQDDARKLDHKTLEEMRARAVRSVQNGQSPEVVAQALGINRTTIYDWLAKYRRGGWNALKAQTGAGTSAKAARACHQMGLWYGHAEKSIAVEVRVCTLDARDDRQADYEQVWCETERRLGWAASGAIRTNLSEAIAPSARAGRALVQQWLKKEYPKIRALAAREKADIYFGDAAHIRSDHHAGRTWGKKGQTPIVLTTGQRRGMSMISAITSRGHLRFMIIEDGSVNADAFIEFIKRLLVGAKRKIFLIVDGGPAHRAKKTKAFVESLQGKLQLFLLPPYSPDRNPDELVWKHVKADTVGRMVITSKDDLMKKVRSSLLSLQRLPSKIRSFFQKETLKYAAWTSAYLCTD